MSRPRGCAVAWLRRHRLPLITLTAPPAVESVLTSVIDAGAPGLVAQVWGGRSRAEAKGLANLDQQAPMRPGDWFRIASLTKTCESSR